ncbi:hypothetical protein BpHYR1_017831 [Brachionus plicatilis]|uniref:Uncharacterized protein n=1 Tax=Brachionus plicatilis TaxID=10195 RepID=A0A3M7P7Q6_BRAPC|nr:hypothetical protein BpHYR1_017831 [Brachionus plicatilis]
MKDLRSGEDSPMFLMKYEQPK